jgi:predicted DCC family thiol-disulfide oxidoreductase YuxK
MRVAFGPGGCCNLGERGQGGLSGMGESRDKRAGLGDRTAPDAARDALLAERRLGATQEIRASGDRHLLLWDGECGFCRRCVRWMRERDRAGLFETVPYQELSSPPMTPDLAQACARAVHVFTRDGARLRGGRAVLFVTEQLGWRRTSRVLGLPPLVWLVELGYRLVARNRRLVSRLLPAERG